MKLRHEWKHEISEADRLVLEARFGAALYPDTNGIGGRYEIRSLYFDDDFDTALREKLGDRAILRAIHFFSENKRVTAQKKALEDGDLALYFENVIASGKSSFCYLQNVYTVKNIREQGLSLALSLAEAYLDSRDGAYRVHGGGFAGTIQAYVKSEDAEGFATLMNAAFGEGACLTLQIRQHGAIKII